MNTPEISVIVPVYNVEKYLSRCIDSVLAQTFTDFELILVDDGSTDASSKICDEYAGKDSRIRVIHKENGGISTARNKGTEEALGKYIIFIDSDDFIEENALDILLNLIIKNSADIAAGGIYNCYENKRIAQCSKNEEFICSGTEALGYLLEGVLITGSSCGKLIKTDLAKKHPFPFGKTYEDAFYMTELLLDTQVAAVTTRPLYSYWHRTGSITTTAFSDKAMHVIEAYEYTLDKVMGSCPQLKEQAFFRLYWAYFTVLDRILLSDNFKTLPQYKTVVSFLKKNWFNILKCKYFQKSRRTAVVFLKLNVTFYRLLLRIRNKNNEVIQ